MRARVQNACMIFRSSSENEQNGSDNTFITRQRNTEPILIREVRRANDEWMKRK